MVDDVVVDTSSNKLDVWRRHPFHVLFKGDDWLGTPKGDKLERDMNGVGVHVLYLPYTVHTSSTILRRALDDLLQPDPEGVS
jgi:glycerol-3-phosphate cytidylyltransferase